MKTGILFILQAGKKYGTGHLKRCLNIASLYEDVFFLIYTDLKDEAPLLELVPYPSTITSSGDKEALGRVLASRNFDMIILDCAEAPRCLMEACSKGIPSITLDNEALGAGGDIFVKSLFGEGRHPANFSGWHYTPIQKKFFKLPEEGSGVLITLGGSDPHCHALKAAAAFKDSGRPVTLIKGALSSYSEIESYEGLSIESGISDLAPYFKKSSLIICGPGMTLLEALAAKKSVLVITHNEKQYRQLRGLDGFKVLSGNALLNPKSIKNASAKITPGSLSDAEDFDFSSWIKGLISGILCRPACCPLCGSHQKKALERNGAGSVFLCRKCGSSYFYSLIPPSEGEEQTLIQDQEQGSLGSQAFLQLREDCRRRLLVIKSVSPETTASGGHKLLDIGAREGDFIQLAVDNGIQSWGVEFSRSQTQGLYNIEIFENMEKAYRTAPYTIITVWNNLNLASKPLPSLKDLSGLLSSGGILAFRAPACSASFYGQFQMTAKGGELLALRLGLKPLKVILSPEIQGQKFWEVYCARP